MKLIEPAIKPSFPFTSISLDLYRIDAPLPWPNGGRPDLERARVWAQCARLETSCRWTARTAT